MHVTIREEIVRWMDEQIEKLGFASRSHGIEYALQKPVEQEGRE